MATLTGTQIKNTYDSLLKIEDNDGISSSTKLITDGLGNATPLSISTSQVSSSVDIQASSFSTPGGLATDVLMANGTTASFPSGNQILDWTVAIPGSVIHNSNIADLYSGFRVAKESTAVGVIGSGMTLDFKNGINTTANVIDDISNSNSLIVSFDANSLSGGTDNYIPLWNGTTALDSSVIAQSGSKIGIGESSPSETLVVREGTSDSSIKVLSYNNALGTESSIKFASVASGANFVKGGIAFRRSLSAGRGDIHFLNDNNTDNGGVSTTDDTKMIIKSEGDVGIGTTDPKSKLQVVGLSSYADNAAAISGGLTVGAFYHTSGTLKVVI